METPLKDYQRDAVLTILRTLGRARDDWRQHSERTSFALSAPTSSGKTVMAAAAIEAVLHGSDEFDVDADPSAVFLWVSKDPALNAQTRARFIQHADRIPISDLVMLDKGFAEESLQTGTLYFINPDKLAVSSGFVKLSDSRSVTFWDILRNTINDPKKTLYMVLDEAHEGMKRQSSGEATIVQKIINGNGVNPAMPIVFGISATLDRFTEAMKKASNRVTRPNVEVDPKDVQASGLIKTSIHLDIPDEPGEFTTTMVRDATLRFVEVCKRWDAYTDSQGIDQLAPLLVVQIPNKDAGESSSEKGKADEAAIIHLVLETIRQYWPEMPMDGIAHVTGTDGAIVTGQYVIPHVAPQLVQQQTHIRVLIAKDAISTGWDCPRAEVLVSLRPGKDPTYVTQLIGRMVRTPLARSTSVDQLNTASAFLPRFDKDTTKVVVDRLLGRSKGSDKGDSTSLVEKVLLKPITLVRNPQIAPDVADLIETLPSYSRPTTVARPIKRLLKAAQAFGQDQIVADANAQAHAHLFKVLDDYASDYADQLDAEALQIRTADISQIRVDTQAGTTDEAKSQRDADINTVNDALRHLRRILTASVVNGYRRREAQAAIVEAEADGGSVLDLDMLAIDSRVAALGLIELPDGEPSLVSVVEDAADALTKLWLTTHAKAIKDLPDSRKPVYDEIRGMATKPELIPVEVKVDEEVDSVDEDLNKLSTVERHVLADAHGFFPLEPKLNRWERAAIEHELGDKSDPVVGWYRNPSSASKHSVRVPYEAAGKWKSMQPDLIFVREDQGLLVPSIVDPHGAHLGDASPKLKALAEYANRHGDRYGRIIAVGIEEDGYLIGISLKDPAIQRAVFESPADKDSIVALFEKHGKKYASIS